MTRRTPARRAPYALVVLVVLVVLAVLLPACASEGSDTTAPTGTISRIGPRVIDIDRSMMLVVDSLVDSDDDIRLRMRVVNLGESPFDVGADDTFYTPLVVVRDDLGNEYVGRAVEPAVVEGWSVGHFDLRADGPFDPKASAFTVEIATTLGLLTTEPAPAPVGDAAQFRTEAPAVAFDDLSATREYGRTVRVHDITDRGTHVEVAVDVVDPSGISLPDDMRATLTSADGTRLAALPSLPTATDRPTSITGVLRFPGTLPFEPDPLTLDVAGIGVEIPAAESSTVASAPPFADLPRLPDLIHARMTNELLLWSTFSPTAEG